MGEDRWRNHVTGGIDGKRYTAREAPARVMQKHERGAEAYRRISVRTSRTGPRTGSPPTAR